MNPKRKAAGLRAQVAGDSFENSVEANNRAYETQGTALVDRLRLTAWFSKGGVKAGKSPPDFSGTIKVDGRFVPVLFDCKSFAGPAWKFSEWNPAVKHNKHHQLQALRRMDRFGGLAFALVRHNSIAIVDSGLVVDEKTGGGGAWHSFGYPAWLVPLAMIEESIRQDHWSITAELLDNSAAIGIRGADWLPAAREIEAKRRQA